jgi:hypothetical protein
MAVVSNTSVARHEADEVQDALNRALRDVGVLMPPVWAVRAYSSEHAPYVIALGNCDIPTARVLTEALKQAKIAMLPPLSQFQGKGPLKSAEKRQFGEALRYRYERGASISELSRESGRSRDTVRFYLEKSGATIRA